MLGIDNVHGQARIASVAIARVNGRKIIRSVGKGFERPAPPRERVSVQDGGDATILDEQGRA